METLEKTKLSPLYAVMFAKPPPEERVNCVSSEARTYAILQCDNYLALTSRRAHAVRQLRFLKSRPIANPKKKPSRGMLYTQDVETAVAQGKQYRDECSRVFT